MVVVAVNLLLAYALVASHYVADTPVMLAVALGLVWAVDYGREEKHLPWGDLVAETFGAWLAGFIMTLAMESLVGLPVAALLVAIFEILGALMRRFRVSSPAVPTRGESSEPVVFDGHAHALGPPVVIPGGDELGLFWVARQGRRRWSSTEHFEVRSETQRVRVDPAALDTWLDAPLLRRTSKRAIDAAVGALEGARADKEVRIWYLPPEGGVCVVSGLARLEPDHAMDTLRDPGHVMVFADSVDLLVGTVAQVRAGSHRQLVLGSALAATAIAAMIWL